MTRFNLSDWALNHRSFVWFMMIVALVAGALSYTNIGREEDPDFSIKRMIIVASLPDRSLPFLGKAVLGIVVSLGCWGLFIETLNLPFKPFVVF